MNRIQKIALITVICTGTGFLLSAITVTVLYFKIGFPRAWAGLACWSLAGLAGLAPAIFRKDSGAFTCDERDRLINMKAARAGFAISYAVFGLLSMGIWEYYRHRSIETISIHILPILFMAAGITAFFTHALTIIILYGKDKKQFEGGIA